MSAERSLVDTNILIYAFDPGFEHHDRCQRLFDEARSVGSDLCLAPQVLIEFYSVVTNPRRVHTARAAYDDIERSILHPDYRGLFSAKGGLMGRYQEKVRDFEQLLSARGML